MSRRTEFYPVFRLEITEPAACERISRVLIDNRGGSVGDITYAIWDALKVNMKGKKKKKKSC